MKHRAMKSHEAQGSSLGGSKEGRTPNVQGQIRLLLGAALERGKDNEMSIS
jgi:hypothetical protein